MKKILIMFGILTLAITLSACGTEEKGKEIKEISSPVDLVLRGEHQLRKMVMLTEKNSKELREIFLLSFSEKKEESVVDKIKFFWKMNNGQYAFSSLPIEKFRVDFNDTITTPTVKFRWYLRSALNPDLIQKIMDKEIIYVLLTIREKDWPVDIGLPMNKTKSPFK